MAAPAWLIGWFLWQDGLGARLTVAVITLEMGILLIVIIGGLNRRLLDALFEKGRLAQQVLELEIDAERGRIARELHDGLAADLSAIAWRVDVLARDEHAAAAEQLAAVSRRARAAIDDAASVVWALRGEPVPFDGLAESVRSRCTELCEGRVDLTIDVDQSGACCRRTWHLMHCEWCKNR